MKKENMSMEELRILLLKYHKEKNYEIFDSFPIKPDNDPTTLFVSAAMSPFKNSYLENGNLILVETSSEVWVYNQNFIPMT